MEKFQDDNMRTYYFYWEYDITIIMKLNLSKFLHLVQNI